MARETERLGHRFETWITDWFHRSFIGRAIEGITSYYEGYKARLTRWRNGEYDALARQLEAYLPPVFVILLLFFVIVILGYPGEPLPTTAYEKAREEAENLPLNIMVAFANTLKNVAQAPSIRSIAEELGSIVVDPVLELLLPPPGVSEIDGMETARRFTGLVVGLPMASSALESVSRFIPGDVSLDFRNMTSQVYWALGLGFLGWQSLSPALRIALQAPMERYYNVRYRPERFNLSTLIDLYMLGHINSQEFLSRGAELGWTDRDLLLLLQAAHRMPTRGDLRAMRERGLIGPDEHLDYLRKLGYNEVDASRLLVIDSPEEEIEAEKTYRSTLKAALKEGLITEEEYRSAGKELGWSDYQIDLDIQLVKLDRENRIKQLTKADVERGFKRGVLNLNDVYSMLEEVGFSPQSIDVLVQTWRAEMTSKTRRINSASIRAAIVAGVISPERGKALLLDIGYPEEDADIIVNTAVAQATKSPREASVGAYMRALREGIITELEFRDGLRDLGYSNRAIQLYLQLSTRESSTKAKTLAESKALDLYTYGKWSRAEALEYLLDRGYSPEDAENILWLEDRKAKVSEIVAAFRQGLLPQEEAVQRLVHQGYTEAEALEKLGVRERRLGKNDILNGLVSGLNTIDEAIELLISIGYSEENAIYLVTSELWLGGVSDILLLYRTERISYDEAIRRLKIIGYDEGEARRLLEEAVFLPTTSDILRAFQVGLLEVAQASVALQALGLSPTDAAIKLQTVVRETGKEHIKALFKQKFITMNEATRRLAWLGMNEMQSREYLLTEEETV